MRELVDIAIVVIFVIVVLLILGVCVALVSI